MTIAAPAKPKTDLPLEFWARPHPHRTGWTGHFQTEKGVKTVASRFSPRSALIFGSEDEAKIAAANALLKHVQAAPRPRSAGAKTFAVRRNGRRVMTLSIGKS
jgi:hypothetical protein